MTTTKSSAIEYVHRPGLTPARAEIELGIWELNDFELQPLLFKLRRLLKGKQTYGSNYPDKRNWMLEGLEELDDYVNYAVWDRKAAEPGM